MESNKRNVGWGIFLICLGLIAMAQTYFNWEDWIAVAILGLGGLIGLVVFLTETSDWVLLIPVYVMSAIAGITAVAIWGNPDDKLFPSVVIFLIALPFLAVYIRKKDNWWALIPSYVLLIIIPIILFENLILDELIATYIMTAIGLPFLYVYLRNRENWWALIPAYTMFVIGIMIGLIGFNILDDLMIPAYIFMAIAVPFLYVYYQNREHWWALIPGGITGMMGLAFLLSASAAQLVGPAIMILAGLWLLWRQYKKQSV